MKVIILILFGFTLISCNDNETTISSEVDEHCNSALQEINETLKIFEVRETHDISTIMLVKMRMIHSSPLDRTATFCIRCRDIELDKKADFIETYLLLSSELDNIFFGIDDYDYPLTANEAEEIKEFIIQMQKIMEEINNLPLLK
ncbi:MAG: hypothetical protein GQ574_15835 [Crocinitomix sp.]|nr:hypothetical protein [Crocinitomix sp.]